MSGCDGYCWAYFPIYFLRGFEVLSRRLRLIESHEEFSPRAIVLHRTIRSLKHDDRQLDVVARSQGWLNQVLVAGEARPTVGEAVTVLAVLEGLAVGKDIQPSPSP